MWNLILGISLLVGITSLSISGTYASMAETMRAEDTPPPSKKKRIETYPVHPEHEKENLCKAQQLYREGSQFQQAKQWENAFKKMEEAAKLGSAEASFNLYVDYRIGRGCKVSLEKAVGYCKSAAGKGYPPALNSLGMMHELGENEFVEKDLEKAIDYYKEAMDKGDTTALENLERILEDEER